jgi:hypothetical protein
LTLENPGWGQHDHYLDRAIHRRETAQEGPDVHHPLSEVIRVPSLAVDPPVQPRVLDLPVSLDRTLVRLLHVIRPVHASVNFFSDLVQSEWPQLLFRPKQEAST